MSILRPSETEQYVRLRPRAQAAFERAQKVMPQGIAQEMRLLRPFPIMVARAKGARKWDVDGHDYIDYHLGSAALILGHAHPEVMARIREQIEYGWHYAQGHPLEAEWGEWVQRLVPSVERLRFVNSGTEATLLALRLARAYTGKPKVLRFEGHYHGWHDYAIKGMSAPFDRPPTAGIPDGAVGTMVVVPANDPDLVARTLDADPEIGQVIVEASGASWSTVPLRPGFLHALREITKARGRLLIFDEVITGFRWSSGGAQVKHGVRPDLTTMSKIASGGLPGGVVGGSAEVMSILELTGDAQRDRARRPYHGGTFNANPLAASAAVATLRICSTGDVQRHCDALAARLREGLNAIIKRLGISGVAYGESSTFHVYVGPRPAGMPVGERLWTEDAATLKGVSRELVFAVRGAMYNRGVDLMSGIGGVLCSEHTPGDIEQTLDAFESAFKAVRDERPDLLPA
ncbi:MAG: aminotransferase class III-fold pyridoxal phosphate-dependent enzyme [Chloroflexi bacterium]|nr:aminotransferase class III-fold pyridoxal phosphate-dependent enzyme [Chloroflexota bacterium]